MKNNKIIAGITACALIGCPTIISGLAPGSSITAEAADYTDTAYGDYNCRKYKDHIEITGIKASATEAIIPEKIYGLPVTAVKGFSHHKNLTKAVIPSTVTSIDDFAFAWCSSLKYLEINANIAETPADLCVQCYDLETVVLPKNLKIIGARSFDNCSSLKNITIPSSVVEIKLLAFSSCSSLTSLKLPDTVKYIGQEAFWYCSKLSDINIPKQIISIGGSAFTKTAIKSIELPSTLEEIWEEAFAECPNLTGTAIIPVSVKKLGRSVFKNCPNISGFTILNPECNILGVFGIGDNIKYISGYNGSTAHIFANNNNIEFISLGDAPSPAAQGDADGDGLITGSDATLALREYTLISSGMDGILDAAKKEAIDVDHDGIITGSDATMILRYYTLLSSGMSPDWNNL